MRHQPEIEEREIAVKKPSIFAKDDQGTLEVHGIEEADHRDTTRMRLNEISDREVTFV